MACFLRVATQFILVLVAGTQGWGDAVTISPPAESGRVVDLTGLLTESDKGALTEIARGANDEIRSPIYVVLVNSMSEYGGNHKDIQRFSRSLFESWGANPDFEKRAHWRDGILLVVARRDRKARIALGANWGGRYDELCQGIMQDELVPKFRSGDYRGGVFAGVRSLAAMAQGEMSPGQTRYGQLMVILIVFFGTQILLYVFVRHAGRLIRSASTQDAVTGLEYDDQVSRRRDLDDYQWNSDSGLTSGSSSSWSDFGSGDYGGGGGASGSW